MKADSKVTDWYSRWLKCLFCTYLLVDNRPSSIDSRQTRLSLKFVTANNHIQGIEVSDTKILYWRSPCSTVHHVVGLKYKKNAMNKIKRGY